MNLCKKKFFYILFPKLRVTNTPGLPGDNPSWHLLSNKTINRVPVYSQKQSWKSSDNVSMAILALIKQRGFKSIALKKKKVNSHLKIDSSSISTIHLAGLVTFLTWMPCFQCGMGLQIHCKHYREKKEPNLLADMVPCTPCVSWHNRRKYPHP